VDLSDKIKDGVPLSVDLIGENGLIGLSRIQKLRMYHIKKKIFILVGMKMGL
jgi:hypothetical protein